MHAKVVGRYKNNIEEQTTKQNKGKNIETKVWKPQNDQKNKDDLLWEPIIILPKLAPMNHHMLECNIWNYVQCGLN
jgi:hypothetical protein